MTDTDQQALTVKKRGRSIEDEKRFHLPDDIRRKRIFWILSMVFVSMLILGILLVIMLLGITRPPGFGNAPGIFAPNFRASIYGPADAMLNRPSGVAVSPTGEIYASDTGNGRVVVFDQSGNLLRSITNLIPVPESDGPTGIELPYEPAPTYDQDYIVDIEDSPEAFVAPTSLAFAADGRWFAVDQALRTLFFFTEEDELIRGVTFEEEAPIGVSVNRVGNSEQLFITTRSGVITGDLAGNFTSTFMNWGIFGGHFDNPTAVVVFNPLHMAPEASISETDTAQLTIVADTLNNRVQAFRNFQTAPELAWVFGSPLSDPAAAAIDDEPDLYIENQIEGSISLPVDLALSPLGRLFVLDGLSSEIIVLNAQTGVFEYRISEVGMRDGLLYYPAGIYFHQGDVYVADRFNDRLSIFEDVPPVPLEVEEVLVGNAFNRWLLLIPPLLALLAIVGRLLYLRMPRYVVDLPFLESLSEDMDLLLFVDSHFSKLSIVAGTESVAEDMLPGFGWRPVLAKDKQIDSLLADNPGLSELEAEAVAIAAAKKRRSYLLTASRPAEKVAEDLGLKVLSFFEFRTIAQAIIEEEDASQGDSQDDQEENHEEE